MSRFGNQKDHEFDFGYAVWDALETFCDDIKCPFGLCLKLRGEIGLALSYKPMTHLQDELKLCSWVRSWREKRWSKKERGIETMPWEVPTLNSGALNVCLTDKRMRMTQILKEKCHKFRGRKMLTASNASMREATLFNNLWLLITFHKSHFGDIKRVD